MTAIADAAPQPIRYQCGTAKGCPRPDRCCDGLECLYPVEADAVTDAAPQAGWKPKPCTCGAYRFPHREGLKCQEYQRWLAEDRWAVERSERNLSGAPE